MRYRRNFFIRPTKRKYNRWKKNTGIVFGTFEMCNESGLPDYSQSITKTDRILYRHDLGFSLN